MQTLVKHKETWNPASSIQSLFRRRIHSSFSSSSTYPWGRNLRSQRGRWNPGGHRRLVRPQRSQRGTRGATRATEATFWMADNPVAQSWGNSSKQTEKEDIWRQPLFERHHGQPANRVKRSLLLFRVQPEARCDRPTDDSLEESDKVNCSATRNVWKRTKSSSARQKVGSRIYSHPNTWGPCVKTHQKLKIHTRCKKS